MKFLTNYFFLLFPLIFTGFEVYAQSSYPLSFTNFQKKDGLSSSYVQNIAKDKYGFLWVATIDGLCRFDGPNMVKVYKKSGDDKNEFNSLEANNIRALFVTKNGKLWIGTKFGGLTSFDPATNKWQTYRFDPNDNNSINSDEVLVIYEDSKNRIWVGTELGLNLFDPETSKFTRFKLFNENVKDNIKAVLSIMEDKNGWIWVGTWAGGLHLIATNPDGQINTDQTIYFEPTSDKSTNNIWSLLQDKDERYWLGTHGGGILIMSIPENATNVIGDLTWKPKFQNYRSASSEAPNLHSNSIQVLKQDAFENIWIGTTHGLYRIKSDKLQAVNSDTKNPIDFEIFLSSIKDEKTISGNNITDILEDEQGLIWLATTNGLSQFNWFSNQIKSYHFPDWENELAFAPNIFIDFNNNIWVGASEGGILKFKLEDGKLERLKVDFADQILGSYVCTIHCPNKNSLYIGTDVGITLVDLKSGELKVFPLTGPNKEVKNLEMTSILVDSKNFIWASTKSGLIKVDPVTKDFTYYVPNENKHSISDYAVNHIIQDSKGDIWVATHKGLNRIKDASKKELEFEKFLFNPDNPDKGPRANEIMHLKEIGNYLYVGTIGGLCRYNYETQKFNAIGNDYQRYRVRSIEDDHNNNIWMSTHDGIIHIDESRQLIRSYLKKDGLQNTKFQLGSSCKDMEGNIYFATVDGFTLLEPNDLKTNTIPPPVFITEIEKTTPKESIVLEGIQDNELYLDYDTYRLQINFAVLNYNRFEKNKIEYKLEGFEKKWNRGKLGTPIVYTSLKPNNYTLRIRAANNDGVWNEEGASLSIIQNAPYWQKWWFRITLFLLITIITISIIFWYTNKIRRHNEELQAYNKILNQEITNRKRIEKVLSDNNIELKRSNKDLEQFAYVSSHDLKEPLRSIGSFSNLLARKYNNLLDENAKEYIQFIEKGVERMFVVIDSLLTYSTVGNKEDTYSSFSLNDIVQSKILDLNQLVKEKNAKIILNDLPKIIGNREQIGMVFFNLISNAIKFNIREQPQVTINCKQSNKDYWEFTVEDNGIGIDEKHKEKVFNFFNRLHSKREYEGTGIGLAVCDKIVSRHNGGIWFEKNKNNGTTFFFRISKHLCPNTSTDVSAFN